MSALHLRPSPPPRKSLSSTSLVLAPIARPWARKRWWAVCSSNLFDCLDVFVSVSLFPSTFIVFLWPVCVCACYQQEEDLEAQVSYLQGQINDLEAMSKYCAKMMNSHICEYTSNRWSNLHVHCQCLKHESVQILKILNSVVQLLVVSLQVKSRKWFSKNTWRKKMRSWCHWLVSNRWVWAFMLSAHQWYVFVIILSLYMCVFSVCFCNTVASSPVRSKTSLRGRCASTKASWRPRTMRRSPSRTITTPPQLPLKLLWVPTAATVTPNNKETAGGAGTLTWTGVWARMRKKRRSSRRWLHLSSRLIYRSSFRLLELKLCTVITCIGINYNTQFRQD